ncbi:hypothetical protein QVH35_03795 [Candidatus Nitrosotenuis chungbukensis]|uniref:hypothetical protein n=1 Tax=Candidatus Nitrosotenuis chungbukensis TaxID=1353246 RepID=UPI0005B2CF14|nr:hypothetical protein [Candidatus Nitrosotenuis chungbukensis]WKT58517.1 hypothetical protein QVH35_03795 [Candidatus Nitrosotenuis chungbukensis]
MVDKAKGAKTDIKSLIVLEDYLSILLEAYPNPIRATDLAKKTDKSKAAISKIRKRILQVCDPKTMIFGRSFLLSDDLNTLQTLFVVFAAAGKHRQFLSSKLVRHFLSRKAIHPRIIEQFPTYAKYFEVGDTEFLFDKLLGMISKVDPKDLESLIKGYYINGSVLDPRNLPYFSKVLNKIQLEFKNDKELLRMLSIRDKFFYLIRDTLWSHIEKMSILDNLTQQERETYLNVYKHTVDFYLKKIFSQLNEPLVNAAITIGLNKNTLPLEVGSTALVK